MFRNEFKCYHLVIAAAKVQNILESDMHMLLLFYKHGIFSYYLIFVN